MRTIRPKLGVFSTFTKYSYLCCFITQLIKKLQQWSLYEVIEDILLFVLHSKRPLSNIWLLRNKQHSFGCSKKNGTCDKISGVCMDISIFWSSCYGLKLMRVESWFMWLCLQRWLVCLQKRRECEGEGWKLKELKRYVQGNQLCIVGSTLFLLHGNVWYL